MTPTAPPPQTTPQAAARGRFQPLQGLRGIAIVLVAVSHAWVILPTGDLLGSAAGGFFRSGNLAVTVFMVVAGFLLVTSLLRELDAGRLDVQRAVVRRWARLSAHVYLLVVVMVVTALVDSKDVYAPADTGRSVLRILTYTWNWFVMQEPLLARPDGGHLWFVSVYLQMAIVLIVLTRLLGRRRLVLLAVLAAAIVAVTLWRPWSYDHEGPWVAFLRTTTRCDGILWGAALAVAMPWLRPGVSRAGARLLATTSGFGLLLLSWTASDDTYFRLHGILICLVTCAFLVACASGGEGPVTRVLSWRPLVVLGDAAMAVYIWHYPVFWSVSKHTPTWEWPAKAVLAVALTCVLTYAAQRWVERPLTDWLDRSRPDGSPRRAALRLGTRR